MSLELKKPHITAREEFEKNPDLTREDLNELREWLVTQKHLPEITDEMLILFHHSCYYQLPATKDCIEMFYTTRSHSPEFFTNRDVNQPALAKAMTSMNYGISPVSDPDGNLVVYYALREFETSKFNQSEHMKVFTMMLDIQFLEAGTRPGLVIVFNMAGAKFGHMARLNLFAFKKFFLYLQEANPVRLKKIHLINVVPFIDKLLMLVRPFLKKELISLLHFHTNGMEEFFSEVPPKCLPQEIGGSLDSIDVLNALNTEKLAAYADFFLEDEKARVDESKRDKRKKSKQTKAGPDIEFEKLEID